MATITIADYINQLQVKLDSIKENQPLAIAVADTHAMMVERIFDEGLDSEGFKKSYNSTDEIYINPNDSPVKFAPKGKPSDRAKKVAASKKKTIKKQNQTLSSGGILVENKFERKTKWFDSYKTFRGSIGRETKFWNLNLFGILRSDFSNSLKRVDNDTWTAGVKTEIDSKKVEKFQNYFKLNEAEREHFKEVLLLELLKIADGKPN